MKFKKARTVLAVLTCAIAVIALSLISVTNKAAADGGSITQTGLPIKQESLPKHENDSSKSSGTIENSLGTGSFTTFFTFRGNGVFSAGNALRFNLAGVNSNSRVFVTAGEFGPDPTIRQIGQARIAVFNIAPFNGGFLAWVEINFGSPINVRFDVFVDP
jgi:hypothetical protein